LFCNNVPPVLRLLHHFILSVCIIYRSAMCPATWTNTRNIAVAARSVYGIVIKWNTCLLWISDVSRMQEFFSTRDER